ncbi:hypothetical protein SAMN02990966_01130 [Rhodospirillales bacterium URHD0017]|nr:hypothetical protein SAMN02990966_01130 [Rhodospirillales bacterium URHD0017]
MTRASRGLGATLATAVLTLGLSAAAQTDNFMSECQQGSSAADPVKACTCMSEKVSGAIRADAIAAMHTMNTTKGANGGGPDPKTLPANQQKGLEAVIAAHGQCR